MASVNRDGQGCINTFLRQLYSIKGDVGKVDLHAWHWDPATPNSRTDFHGGSRGFVAAGPPETVGRPNAPGLMNTMPAATGKPTPSQPNGGGVLVDGMLQVEEHLEFKGITPRSGYLALFNLGTSGDCCKLSPSKEHEDNFVREGDDFTIPSKRLVDITLTVGPPTTEESGAPERILVLVTDVDVDLECTDLHPRLPVKHALSRGVSRGGIVRKAPGDTRAKLFQMEPDTWDYGLLEIAVLAR